MVLKFFYAFCVMVFLPGCTIYKVVCNDCSDLKSVVAEAKKDHKKKEKKQKYLSVSEEVVVRESCPCNKHFPDTSQLNPYRGEVVGYFTECFDSEEDKALALNVDKALKAGEYFVSGKKILLISGDVELTCDAYYDFSGTYMEANYYLTWKGVERKIKGGVPKAGCGILKKENLKEISYELYFSHD